MSPAGESNGQPVGFVGELHPKWRQAYDLPLAPVLFELDASVLSQRVVPAFQSVPRMQSVYRDLALVVSDTTAHDAVIGAITQAATDGLVRGARLFDIYKPKTPVAGMAEHERSLAVRVELRDDEQTLTDDPSSNLRATGTHAELMHTEKNSCWRASSHSCTTSLSVALALRMVWSMY